MPSNAPNGGTGGDSPDDTDAAQSPTSAASAIAPLRIRWFRALWIANAASQAFWLVHQVAVAWLMLELTGSAIWVSFAIASSTLPILALGLVAGAGADLWDRRRVLIATQSAMAVASVLMAALWAFDLLTPGVLLGLGVLIGVALAFDRPAWQALLPDLVPHRLVASAVALNSTANNAAKVIGPALGGLIVATVGAGVAFALNGVSYIGVIIVVAGFRSAEWTPQEETSFIGAIGAGIRYARFSPHFRWLLLTVSLFGFTSAGLAALLPSITRDSLGGSSVVYGMLLGMQGLGAIGGAAIRGRATSRLGRAMIPISTAGFATGMLIVGVAGDPVVASAGAFISGLAWLWTLTTLHSTYVLLAPSWVRGRMMSLYLIAFLGFVPLGSIFSGAIADMIGVTEAMLVMASATAAVAFLALRLPLPELLRIATPRPASAEPEDSHGSGEVGLSGGPVLVENTWIISASDLDGFLDVMKELRLVRLRTGAFRWALYRAAADPRQMIEAMALNSWDDHLRQHHRIDAGAAEIITRARSFDRVGGPFSRHLIAIDVSSGGRPDWEQLIADHSLVHEIDGSIPLDRALPIDQS